MYTLIEGVAALLSLGQFSLRLNLGDDDTWSAIIAFIFVAVTIYALCFLWCRPNSGMFLEWQGLGHEGKTASLQNSGFDPIPALLD